MSSHVIVVQDLVIPNGATDSNILYAQPDYRDGDGITIFAPGVLPETVILYASPVGSPDAPPSASDFCAVQRNGVDFTVPQGKAETLDMLPYKAIKLVANGAVAGTRTFKVNKLVWA